VVGSLDCRSTSPHRLLSSGLVGEQRQPYGNPFCVRACDGACVDNGPACLCHYGRRDPFVSVALATACTQLAAIRASELELDTVLHGLRDANSN
jgi:hypothetical protein